MNLDAYLARIEYTGPRTADLQTLIALHRAHLRSIPYENLDIHLGRSLSLDESAIFAKLVTARRGGWCYEMNGLFAWALEDLGFEVTRLASCVGRQSPDTEDGAHLILMVKLDCPYLADVGFGHGLLEPIPLEAGTYQQDYLTYRLAPKGDRWFFTNHAYGGPGIDFTLRPRSMSDFATHCHNMQTSSESWFVQSTVCHRAASRRLLSLRGAVLRTVTEEGPTERVIDSRADYQLTLREQFGLSLADTDVATLWDLVWQRHVAWAATLNP